MRKSLIWRIGCKYGTSWNLDDETKFFISSYPPLLLEEFLVDLLRGSNNILHFWRLVQKKNAFYIPKNTWVSDGTILTEFPKLCCKQRNLASPPDCRFLAHLRRLMKSSEATWIPLMLAYLVSYIHAKWCNILYW